MTGVSLAGTQLRVNQYNMHDTEWNDVKVRSNVRKGIFGFCFALFFAFQISIARTFAKLHKYSNRLKQIASMSKDYDNQRCDDIAGEERHHHSAGNRTFCGSCYVPVASGRYSSNIAER